MKFILCDLSKFTMPRTSGTYHVIKDNWWETDEHGNLLFQVDYPSWKNHPTYTPQADSSEQFTRRLYEYSQIEGIVVTQIPYVFVPVDNLNAWEYVVPTSSIVKEFEYSTPTKTISEV